jgi:hypothetical protein
MSPLLACAGLLAEEACFSGRLPGSTGTPWSACGGLLKRGRLTRRSSLRASPVVRARYDAGHGVAPRERPAADIHTAAKLRLHSLISGVQGCVFVSNSPYCRLMLRQEQKYAGRKTPSGTVESIFCNSLKGEI